MKDPERCSTLAVKTVAPLVLALCAAAGRAPGQVVARQTPEDRAESALITLEFGGGSLVEYLETLKVSAIQQGVPEFNVAINRQNWADEVEMPPLSLKKIELRTAIQLIEHLAEQETYKVRVLDLKDTDTRSARTFVLMLNRERPVVGGMVQGAEAERLEMFSLASLLWSDNGAEQARPRGEKILETVLTAIDTALVIGSPGEERRGHIKFHAESGLLFVKATEKELGVISDIVEQISLDADLRLEKEAERAQRELEREDLLTQVLSLKKLRTEELDKLEVLQTNNAQLQVQLEAHRIELENLRLMRQDGEVRNREMLQEMQAVKIALEARLKAATDEVKVLQNEVVRLKATIDELKSTRKR